MIFQPNILIHKLIDIKVNKRIAMQILEFRPKDISLFVNVLKITRLPQQVLLHTKSAPGIVLVPIKCLSTLMDVGV